MSSTHIRKDSVNQHSGSAKRNVYEDFHLQKSPQTTDEESASKNLDQGSATNDAQTPRVPRIRRDFCSCDDEDEHSVLNPQFVSPKDILKGVVAYIEVRSNTENRSEAISKQMEMLGAKISKRFASDVTHVIFKDGKRSTKEKAIKKGVYLVSVLWIDSCKRTSKHVPEALFPISHGDNESSPIVIARMKRNKSMQPKSFEEDIKNSAERIEKRNRRLEKLKARTPQDSPLFTKAPNTRTYVVPPSVTPHVVPCTPGGRTVRINLSDQSDEGSDDSSPTESNIEKLAKKLRFVSDCECDSVENSFKYVSLTRTEKCQPEKSSPIKEKEKPTRKLLSLKQNSLSVTELPADPLKSQASETSRKLTEVDSNIEKDCSEKGNNCLHEEDDEEREAGICKKRKCSENEATETSLESSKTVQLKNKNKSDQPKKSLEDFRVQAKIGKPNRKRKRKSHGLAMTSMHFGDQELVEFAVKELGLFSIQENVSALTSHVIAGNGRRTLNVLKAISRGCWILSLEWITKSLETGYWVDEESYELSDDFPSAQLSRLERTTEGDSYQSSLLASVAAIYVGSGTSPSSDEIVNLILMSGGHVSATFRNASICIGQVSKKTESIHVSEKWLLDCITSQSVLPFEKYQKDLRQRTTVCLK